MSGGFVHDIDPIIGTLWGVHLWWYGFVYVAGFLFLHLWLTLNRHRTGMSRGEVYTLSLLFTVGVLLGAVAGTAAFCALRGRSFLETADELAVPGAFVMGMGRLANFIDGQIVGPVR